MKYTKGPWKSCNDYTIFKAVNNTMFGSITCKNPEEQEGSIKMAAAAPEMFELLVRAESHRIDGVWLKKVRDLLGEIEEEGHGFSGR